MFWLGMLVIFALGRRHFANCKKPAVGINRRLGLPNWHLRSRPRARGSILITTLLLAVVLFVLGCAYLSFLERDYRFAGVQERSERAWNLAQSGLEYYRVYGGTLQPLQRSGKALDPPQVLCRVYVPASSKSQYFELADLGQGNMMCQGVVVNSIVSPGQNHEVRRTLVVPNAKLEDAYELSLSFAAE